MLVGFVGADLEALTKEAAAIAISRIFKQIEEKDSLAQLPQGGQAMGILLLIKSVFCNRYCTVKPFESKVHVAQ